MNCCRYYSWSSDNIITSSVPNMTFQKGNFVEFMLQNSNKWSNSTALVRAALLFTWKFLTAHMIWFLNIFYCIQITKIHRIKKVIREVGTTSFCYSSQWSQFLYPAHHTLCKSGTDHAVKLEVQRPVGHHLHTFSRWLDVCI